MTAHHEAKIRPPTPVVEAFGKHGRPLALAYTLAGIAISIFGLRIADTNNPRRLFIYLICSGIAVLGLRLAASQSFLPLGLLVVLLGLDDLNLPELLFIAFNITLLYELRRTERIPQLGALLFALATATIGVASAQAIYRMISQMHYNALYPAPIIAASLALLLNFQLASTLLKDRTVTFAEIYRRECRPQLPWLVAAAYVAYLVQSASHQAGMDAGLIALPILLALDRGYRIWFAAKAKHTAELAALHERTLETLSVAIDARDHTTQMHLRRVQFYARAVGEELGLSEAQLRDLHVAALLHDIGKLGIPDHILLKPGPLSPEEWEKMKTHPATGAEMLSRMNFPDSVLAIVETHHEKWDGTGYPKFLYGESIPIGARILSAVDCLDALASERPYRKAMPLKEAMDRIRAGAGSSFDPKVISVLERRYVELERMAWGQAISATPAPDSLSCAEDLGKLAANLLVELNSASPLDPIVSARQETQLMHALAADLAHCTQVKEVAPIVHKYLGGTLRYDTLVLYRSRAEMMEPICALGGNASLFAMSAFPVEKGLSGRAAQMRVPILNGDPSRECSFVNDSEVHWRLQSALAVPLAGRNGVAGTLTIYHPDRNAFRKDDVRILEAAGVHVGLAIESAMIYQHAEEQAVTDHLTGIPNARSLALHLGAELSRAEREKATIGVLVCDLDGFKQVNDRFGHLQGNQVLQHVARGLREGCRASDYSARMGGDEFVLVLPDFKEELAASYVARLRAVAEQAGMEVCGEQCLSMSVGVAIFPDDGRDPETLLGKADRRMYTAKQDQRVRPSAHSVSTASL
jgi:diguanylate cyclase (GGDEF)-like protein/putative nucleotidyltransferase with HDIG domain